MVGSGDHRPSLLQVAETIFPLQVKLRVDATSTGSGGATTMVTRTAGDGLEGQVTESREVTVLHGAQTILV